MAKCHRGKSLDSLEELDHERKTEQSLKCYLCKSDLSKNLKRARNHYKKHFEGQGRVHCPMEDCVRTWTEKSASAGRNNHPAYQWFYHMRTDHATDVFQIQKNSDNKKTVSPSEEEDVSSSENEGEKIKSDLEKFDSERDDSSLMKRGGRENPLGISYKDLVIKALISR